jgi:predicted phage terminase large subunit-like protein
MSIQSNKFENGKVFLPIQARWLAELETELFSFPGSRHDDQIDSISQALANTSGFDSSLSWVGV